ncbi:acyl-CoA thioesterase [Longispora albida]|uniref:acyl-CoA thioesterase n=1 Tax=Longispora albida TaxID=203523 RepID=UPI00058E942B|nr:thioesterase family protein [Longispora albida]
MAKAVHHAQVRWSDPDQLGHVNHSRYLSYFEDARMELLSTSPSGLAGAPGDRGYIAARVAVDYRYPVEYRPGLLLRVETWASKLGTSSWTLSQEMYDGEDLVASCECVLVAYSYEGKKSRPLDPDERAFWSDYS